VEEELCEGRVLFHQYVSKTAQEIAHDEQRAAKRRKLKEKRRKEQEANIAKKLQSETGKDQDSEQQAADKTNAGNRQKNPKPPRHLQPKKHKQKKKKKQKSKHKKTQT